MFCIVLRHTRFCIKKGRRLCIRGTFSQTVWGQTGRGILRREKGTPHGKEVARHVCLRARGFVCLPAGQIYLGGRLSKVLPVEISYKQGHTVMLLSRSRLQPNEKLISFICQRGDVAGWPVQLLLSCMNHCLLSSGHTSQVLSCPNLAVAIFLSRPLAKSFASEGMMRHVRDNIRGRGRKVTLCKKLP